MLGTSVIGKSWRQKLTLFLKEASPVWLVSNKTIKANYMKERKNPFFENKIIVNRIKYLLSFL